LGYIKLFAIQIYMSVTIMASFRQTMFWRRCFAKGFEWKTMHLYSY
jgi:hypothetical protein